MMIRLQACFQETMACVSDRQSIEICNLVLAKSVLVIHRASAVMDSTFSGIV